MGQLEKHAGDERQSYDFGDALDGVVQGGAGHDVGTDQDHEDQGPGAAGGVQYRDYGPESVAGMASYFSQSRSGLAPIRRISCHVGLEHGLGGKSLGFKTVRPLLRQVGQGFDPPGLILRREGSRISLRPSPSGRGRSPGLPPGLSPPDWCNRGRPR